MNSKNSNTRAPSASNDGIAEQLKAEPRRWVVWWFEIIQSQLRMVYQDFPNKPKAKRFYHHRHAEGQRAEMGLVSATPWHYLQKKEVQP